MSEEFTNKQTALEQLISNKESFHIFENMSNADIALITSYVGFKKFTKGEAITKEHDLSRSIYFIISGECNAIVSKTIVATITPHTVIGEISGLSDGLRTASVIATKDVHVLELLIDYDSFHKNIVPFAYFYRNLAKSLSHKITDTNYHK